MKYNNVVANLSGFLLLLTVVLVSETAYPQASFFDERAKELQQFRVACDNGDAEACDEAGNIFLRVK